VEKEGSGWTVELAVTSRRWLAELLLRLGPNAEVLAPDEWVGLGAGAAAELLARYEAAGSDGS
jgi:predicted DNA-binding transcriptional regulator YafY